MTSLGSVSRNVKSGVQLTLKRANDDGQIGKLTEQAMSRSEQRVQRLRKEGIKKAPVVEVVSADLQKLKATRQAKYEKSTVREERSSFAPRVANKELEDRRARKAKAREYYKFRLAKRGNRTLNDARYQPELSPEARLNFFNKKHKCECHKLRFNIVEEKEGKFVFGCDRASKPEEIWKVDQGQCRNCCQGSLSEITKENCFCRVTRCSFCKYQIYTFEEKEHIVCSCGAFNDVEAIKRHVMFNIKTQPVNRWKNNVDKASFLNEMKEIANKIEKTILEDPNEFPVLQETVEKKSKVHFPKMKRFSKVKVASHGAALGTAKTVTEAAVTALCGFFNQIKEAMKKSLNKSEKIYSSVKRSVREAKKKINAVVDSIPVVSAAVDKITSFWVKVSDFLCRLCDAAITFVMQHSCFVPSFIAQLYELIFSETSRTRKAVLLGLLTPIFIELAVDTELCDPVIGMITSFFSGWFEDDVDYSSQKNPEEEVTTVSSHGIPAKVKKAFDGLLNVFSKVSGIKTPLSMMSMFRDFNVLCQGSKNIMSLLTGISSFLPKFMKKYLNSVDTKIMLKSELKNRDSIFFKFAQAGLAISIAREAGNNAAMIECEKLFTAHYADLLEYLRVNNIALDTDMIRFVDAIRKNSRLVGSYAPTPDEPFIIRVSGDSGAGKTTLTSVFLSACYPGMSEDEIQAMTYNRNPLAESWDGCLKKHEICVFDDFNQDREEADMRDLILLASRTVFMPPFASIDPADAALMGNKGDVVNFKVILLNGNTRELRANTLNCNEAINRRKHVHYEVLFNTGYDRTKVSWDFKHLKVQSLDAKYNVVWSKSGIEGIRAAQREINAQYKVHKQRIENATSAVTALLFTEDMANKEYTRTESENAKFPAPNSVRLEEEKKKQVQSLLITEDEFQDVNVESHFGSEAYYMALANDFLTSCCVGFADGLTYCAVAKFLHDIFNRRVSGKVWAPVFAVSAGIAAISTFAALRSYVKAEPHSGEHKTDKHTVKIIAHNEVTSDGGEIIPLYQTLKRNTFRCEISEGEEGGSTFTNGIFIKGNVALLNAHLFWSHSNKGGKWKAEGSTMKIYNYLQKEPTVCRFDLKRLVVLRFKGEDRDLCLYKFPEHVQARPTILQHFWHGDVDLTNRKVVSIQHKFEGCELYFGDVVKDNIQVNYTSTQDGKEIRVVQHSACRVSIPSTRGDCGSMTFVNDNLMQQCVVGVNVGGTANNQSVTIYVTQETLKEYLAVLEHKFKELNFERAALHAGWRNPTETDLIKSGLDGVLVLHAIAEKKMVPSGRSKIVKSPLFDQITTHVTEPCIVDLRDKRLQGKNTFLEAMNKYGDPSYPMPEDLIKEAARSIKEEIQAVKTVRLRRTLTTFEAINGVEGYPFLDSLDMTTSAGFPFVCEGLVGEKRQLFDGGVGNWVPNAELQSHIDEIEDRLRNKVLPDYPFINTLKDERKPTADVANGKVRMFSMSNVALSIVMRKLFLPFVAHCYQCRNETFLSVGINKTGPEWDILVNRLLEVSSDFYDMDYKKFDTRANVTARSYANGLFIEDFMSDEEKIMAATALQYDGQALHYFGQYIVSLSMGTSSGSTLTALMGSFINEEYLRTVWQLIMPMGLRDLKYYKKYVRTKDYGDDLSMTVSKEVSQYFNDKAIADKLEEFNITMTPGSKTGEWGVKSVFEFTFLKNKTRKFLGRYVPLAQDPCEQINWIKKGLHAEDPEVACENNCNSALRMLFFYGEEEFLKIRDKILSCRPNYNLISYRSIFEEFSLYGQISDPEGAFCFGSARMEAQSIVKYFESLTPIDLVNVESHSGERINMNCIPLYKVSNGLAYEVPVEHVQPVLNWPCVHFMDRRTKEEIYPAMEDTDKVAALISSTFAEMGIDVTTKLNPKGEILTVTEMVNCESHSGTLDESAAVQTEKVGVVLSEQEPAPSIPRVLNTRLSNTRAEKYNNDAQWTLEKMLTRWNLVATLKWDSTTTPGSNIPGGMFDILADLLTNDIASTPFKRFEKFLCKSITLRFECIGYRFCRGRLLAVVKNTMVPQAQLTSTVSTVREAVTLQHVSLDPADGTTVEMEIPFVYNKQYMDLVNGDCLGQVFLMVQNQFVPGTSGPGEATVKVFMTINGAEFKQPRPGATSFNESMSQVREDATHDFVAARVPRVYVNSHAGVINGLIDDGASALKELANDLLPGKVIEDAVGSLLDRVQIGEQYSPITNKDMGYLGNTRNIDYVDVLTADPSAQQMVDPEMFACTTSEMDIDAIIKSKASFVQTVTWKATDPVGHPLFCEDVGPLSGFPIGHDPAQPVTLTPLDAISIMFAFWRGGYRYFFEFVSTQFHEGKVDINFHPTLSKGTALGLSPVNSVTQYTLSHFMRNVNNMIGVSCPYLGDTPVKKVWRGQDLVDSYIIGNPSLRFADYFSGSVSLRVSTVLNAPSTVQPDIEINVYKLADKDFEFFMNSFSGSSVQYVSTPVTVESHSGSKDIKRNSPFSTMETTMLAAGEGFASDVPHSQFGERYNSLRDLCKKYQPLYKRTFEYLPDALPDTIDGNVPEVQVVQVSIFESANLDISHQNMISAMAHMFRLYRGPLCFKLRVRSWAVPKLLTTAYVPNYKIRAYVTPVESNQVNAVSSDTQYLFPSKPFLGINTRRPVSLGYASDTQVCEFKIPMMSNRTTMLVPKGFEDVDATVGFNEENFLNQCLYIGVYHEGVPNVPAVRDAFQYFYNMELLVAFGDETSFGVWIGPPKAFILTDTTGLLAVAPDEWKYAAEEKTNKKKPLGPVITKGGFKQ